MYQKKRIHLLGAIFIATLLGLVGFAWQSLSTKTASADNPSHLRFDIAEAGNRFAFDEAPIFAEDDMPAYGNPFITGGYIYPAGTLSESNGVLPNGDPEFPDLVLGTWVCRGYFIGDGAHTTTGPWVVTTQIYDLGDTPGKHTITTEGFELSDIGIAGNRAVTGGTGSYSRARGQMQQTLIGFNETMGVNLQVELSVNK